MRGLRWLVSFFYANTFLKRKPSINLVERLEGQMSKHSQLPQIGHLKLGTLNGTQRTKCISKVASVRFPFSGQRIV